MKKNTYIYNIVGSKKSPIRGKIENYCSKNIFNLIIFNFQIFKRYSINILKIIRKIQFITRSCDIKLKKINIKKSKCHNKI